MMTCLSCRVVFSITQNISLRWKYLQLNIGQLFAWIVMYVVGIWESYYNDLFSITHNIFLWWTYLQFNIEPIICLDDNAHSSVLAICMLTNLSNLANHEEKTVFKFKKICSLDLLGNTDCFLISIFNQAWHLVPGQFLQHLLQFRLMLKWSAQCIAKEGWEQPKSNFKKVKFLLCNS